MPPQGPRHPADPTVPVAAPLPTPRRPRESVGTAGPSVPPATPHPASWTRLSAESRGGRSRFTRSRGNPRMVQGHEACGGGPGALRILGPWGRPGERGRKDPASKRHPDPWSQQEVGFACTSQAPGPRRAPGTILPTSHISRPSDDQGTESRPWVMVRLLISAEALINLKALCLLNKRTKKCIHEQIGK